MALKPVTFKIDEKEVRAMGREAKAAKVPRSEYLRDIFLRRKLLSLRMPSKGDGE